MYSSLDLLIYSQTYNRFGICLCVFQGQGFITFRITRESAEFTLKLVIQYFHYHIPLPKFYSFPHTKLILEIPLTSTVSPVPNKQFSGWNTNEKTREICQNMKNGPEYAITVYLHFFPL